MHFKVQPLKGDQFVHLYGKSDETLRRLGVVASIADSPNGYPCRVSLEDAALGDRVLLLNFEHQPANTPFRSKYAIYIKEGAMHREIEPDYLPPYLARRQLSVRGFSQTGLLQVAEAIAGAEARSCFKRLLAHNSVAYLHIHNAAYGCYLAKVVSA